MNNGGNADTSTLVDLWGSPPPRETVSAAAYRALRDAIIKGRLEPGARISELELAEAWRISRTPIRDALRRLEAEGMVQARAGQGMMVPALTPADVRELFDLREALEGLAARRAAESRSAQFHALLNGLIKAYGEAVKAEDLDRVLSVDADFHVAIARNAENRRLAKTIEGLHAQVHPLRMRAVQAKGRAAKSLREVAKLTGAIRAGDPARAEAAMRAHIASVRTDLEAMLAGG